MSGETGWGSRGDGLIASVGIAMILSLSMRMEAAPREARDTHEAAATGTGATPRAEQLSNVDVSDYDRLLHTYVTDEGWVDYAGLARERGPLDRFLAALGKASPNGFKDDTERLAFWINSYNAFTLADALDTVYGKHEGVRQVGGFFNGRKHLVGGKQLTLDEIETRGRNLHDPRIHFAIVCASASCPKLQRFAYNGEVLNSQLDQVARQFFADPNRGLRFDPKENELYVSPILKWYAGDFTGSSGSLWARAKATVSGSELLDFITRYAPAEVVDRIKQNPPTLHYFEYDWSLNSLNTHAAGTKP